MIYHPYDTDIIPIFYSEILTIRLVIYQYIIINISGYVFIIHLAEIFGNAEMISSGPIQRMIISSDFHVARSLKSIRWSSPYLIKPH